MKRIDMMLAAAACLAGAAFAGPVAADDMSDPPAAPMAAPATDASSSSTMTGKKDAKSVIASWPEKTKAAAQALIEKYGQPDMVTNKMLGWQDKDQWSMVGVFRDAVAHNDPVPHEDFIENKISYSVPENKVGDLAKFNHAVVVDQSRGTLAAHCDSEEHNILTLNLANDIVTGKRDVAAARGFQKKTMAETAAGKSSPYTERLLFSVSSWGNKTEPATEAPPMPY
ncbi:MAG: hypothetical protein ACHQ2Z_05665 [Elusimicrobiota bacterium]